MTSNIAGDIIREASEETPLRPAERDFEGQAKEPKEIEKRVWEVLHTVFRPEFLNRLDNVVIFNSLTPKEILKIAEQQLEEVKVRMAENNIDLQNSSELSLHFAMVGFDPIFGARPLRRAIEEQLVDEVALRIIDGNIKPGDVIKPKVKDGKVLLDSKKEDLG
jgi:ATP-dependent Clp protease ATP-binding subunit ClpA